LYTVPDGAGGAYFVQVLGENGSIGEYVLNVSGATAAANPFTVTATDPAANSHHTSFSSMTVTFSESVLLTSVQAAIDAGDIYVSNPDSTTTLANGYSVVNDHTITFTFPTLPTGDEDGLEHDVHLSGIQDLQGDSMVADVVPIFLDNVPPHVVSSNINEGDTVPAGTVDFVVTFSEEMDTSFTTSSSFDLHDNLRGIDIGASSFTWDVTGTVLTIHY